MKKVITFIGIALLALCVKSAYAQDDMFFENNFPAGGGPLVSNIYPIWLDGSSTGGSEAYYGVTPYIVQNLRPNGTYGSTALGTVNVGQRFIDIWSSTYVFNGAGTTGALGQAGGYLDMTGPVPGGTWAGGGFQLLGSQNPDGAYNIDLTKLTDTDRFHMCIRKTTPNPCSIWLSGGGDASTSPAGASGTATQARFSVGYGFYSATNTLTLTPNFDPVKDLNKWIVIDVPVSKLKTLATDGASGWSNRMPMVSGYYLAYNFGGTPGNNLQIDAIFYYSPVPPTSSGVSTVKVNNKLAVIQTGLTVNVLNANGPVDVYNVAGAKVKTFDQPAFGTDELSKGIYIIKSGNAVAKIAIR